MFLKYVFCYFSGIEFPCDVKVIISVVNPEHLKLPVFAGIVMEQFRLGAGAGAGAVDEQKIAQHIHSSRRAKSAVAVAGSPLNTSVDCFFNAVASRLYMEL